MKIELHPDLSEKVLCLTNDYGYAPGEIIGIGIALASVVLYERGLGNQVVILDPQGERVAEFREVEPKAICELVKKYLDSVCDGMEGDSVASLIAKLERERDERV